MGTGRTSRLLAAVGVAMAAVAVAFGAQVPAVGAPPPPTVWLCHPDMASDPCDLPQDTTDLLTGQVTAPPPVPESDKPVDCFYVYPTVSNRFAQRRSGCLARGAVDRQPPGSRFNSTCRVFAPVYRQVDMGGLAGRQSRHRGEPFAIAYNDVLDAWNDYLAHENNGRGVIFIGHSEGALMLRKLIREQIDPNPQLRDRLVGAFLIGANVTTARGSTVGGDFANTAVCTAILNMAVSLHIPQMFSILQCRVSATARSISPLCAPDCRAALSSRWPARSPAVLSGSDEPVGVTVPSAPPRSGSTRS